MGSQCDPDFCSSLGADRYLGCHSDCLMTGGQSAAHIISSRVPTQTGPLLLAAFCITSGMDLQEEFRMLLERGVQQTDVHPHCRNITVPSWPLDTLRKRAQPEGSSTAALERAGTPCGLVSIWQEKWHNGFFC